MTAEGRERIEALRDVLGAAHRLLEATMADVTREMAHWAPPGTALPIAACYAHVVIAEDGIVNGVIKGCAPLFYRAWSGKTGLSALPPAPDPSGHGIPDWTAWARSVRVDPPEVRKYAEAVYRATEEFMATLTDEDLSRPLDLTAIGLGPSTVGFLLKKGLVGHAFTHAGEIACLKGIQGKKGSPF